MGNCFEANARHFLNSSRNDWRLCHGIVMNQIDGLPMSHCWIEYQQVKYLGKHKVEIQWVIDMSNGQKHNIPLGQYYHLGRINPDEVAKYDFDQFGKMILEHGHYGPWEIACDR